LRNQINRAQRNFVVEYKSNRRQPREAAKSIWGDADLRALSKAVVDDMPPPVTVGQLDTSDDMDQHSANAEVQPPEALLITSSGAEQLPAFQSVEPAYSMAETVEDSRPVRIIRKKRGNRLTNRAMTSVHTSEAVPSEAPVASVAVDALDELAALELENRRLKRLLIDKLRRENEQLKEMLRRFWQ
jgi:hypothetical protein